VHAGNHRQLSRLHARLRAQANHHLPERLPALGPKFARVDFVHALIIALEVYLRAGLIIMTIKSLAFDAQQYLESQTGTTFKRGHIYELLTASSVRAIVPTRHTPPQNIVHLHSLTHPLFTAAESV
jgi:hypothetical protein